MGENKWVPSERSRLKLHPQSLSSPAEFELGEGQNLS